MRASGLGLVVAVLGCGPGGRGDTTVDLPCSDFDLVLPDTGNVGGASAGLAWTGQEYLALFDVVNGPEATLAVIDGGGTITWRTQIPGAPAGAQALAWDGRRAAVVTSDANHTMLAVATIDLVNSELVPAFTTSPPGGVSDVWLAGAEGRFGVTWVDEAGRHFTALAEGVPLGPIATLPAAGTLRAFIATPDGYAISVGGPTSVVLLNHAFAQTAHFDIPTDASSAPFGPALAATDTDIVAVPFSSAPNIVVDFLRTGSQRTLPLQFASGLVQAQVGVTTDDGTVYLAAVESSASSRQLGTIVLSDDAATSHPMLSDPLVGGFPVIARGLGRTAIASGRSTLKPSFIVTQRCDP